MVAAFGIQATLITDDGHEIVPASPSDGGNPPEQDPGNGNITSHTFPESVDQKLK